MINSMISRDRMDEIQYQVDMLHELYDLTKFPILMPQVLHDYYQHKVIITSWKSQKDSFDIISNYDEEHDIICMVLNIDRTSPNLHKRLNFSLAHEIGHIELGHYRAGNNTDENKKSYFNEEAVEFAARFLVPQAEVMQIPFDIKYLSDYFFVSPDVIKSQNEKFAKWHTEDNPIAIDHNKNMFNELLDKYLIR